MTSGQTTHAQTGFVPTRFAIFLVFTLWALVLTYPLLRYPFSHIPRGNEIAGTVPLFNLWTLQWNIDQLMQGYPGYWDAPIFAPNNGAFAFSETQPLSALLAAPLWLISPALGYNIVLILFLTLNGWFTYWLLKTWHLSPLPALLAGLLMQSLPFIAQEMGVLQLIAIFGFLWSLLFMSRFLSQSRHQAQWRHSFCFALGPPVTFFTCGYYGLFSLFFLPPAFLAQIQRRHFNLKILGRLLVICLLILALSGPFLLAQRQRLAEYNFTRSAKTIEKHSARLKYYTYFLDHNLFYGQVLGKESGPGQRLFPGFALTLLASLGLLDKSQQRIKLYLVAAIALALLLSLGLRLRPGGFQPYQLVRQYIPGFEQLRSPFRFAVMVQVHLALLAGFGLRNLGRWLPKQGRPFSVTLASLALLESIALPMPLQPIPNLQVDTLWQVWLNQQNRPAQIIMLPFAQGSKTSHFEQTTRWMLESRYFKGRMLNGYSGFFPPNHARLREQMLQFPSAEGIDLLRDMQVDFVIVHHNLPNAPPAKAMMEHLSLVYEDTQANVSIYRVVPQ